MNSSLATPNFDRIVPTECLNAKIRRLHRMLDAIYQSRLKPFGLRGSMLSILFIVGKNEGINQKTIADNQILDQSTVSRDVTRLISKGWIQISRGDDPRNTELTLTEGGYQLLEEVAPIWEETHKEVQSLLGDFNIHQIDSITAAIRNKKEDLKI